MRHIICFILFIQTVFGNDEICKGIEDYEKIPDPESCAKFYQCMNEIGKPGVCPENNWFERELQMCLPKEMVTNCDTETTDPTQGTTTESTTSSTTTTESTTESTTATEPSSSSEITTSEPTTSELTTTTETTTTESTTTSESTTPESSTGSSSTTSEITSTQSSTSTEPTMSPTITYPTGKPIPPDRPEEPEPGLRCPNEPFFTDKPLFLASTTECGIYYLCYLGRPVRLECINGTHWNQYEYFCDDPFYAHCQIGEDPNPFPECPRRGNLVLPYKPSCDYFIHCKDGVGSLQRCSFGYGWDIILKTCVIKTQSRCFQ